MVSYDGTRKINKRDIAQRILGLSEKSLPEIQASTNPRKSEPQSPINILARGKLCGKKPKITPKSKREHKKASLFPKMSDKTARQSDCEAHTPPASPSSPSMILVALVIKINQTEIKID